MNGRRNRKSWTEENKGSVKNKKIKKKYTKEGKKKDMKTCGTRKEDQKRTMATTPFLVRCKQGKKGVIKEEREIVPELLFFFFFRLWQQPLRNDLEASRKQITRCDPSGTWVKCGKKFCSRFPRGQSGRWNVHDRKNGGQLLILSSFVLSRHISSLCLLTQIFNVITVVYSLLFFLYFSFCLYVYLFSLGQNDLKSKI